MRERKFSISLVNIFDGYEDLTFVSLKTYQLRFCQEGNSCSCAPGAQGQAQPHGISAANQLGSNARGCGESHIWFQEDVYLQKV